VVDLELTEVENGYIIRRVSIIDRTSVFKTFDEVIQFLKEYYDIKEEI